MTSQEAFDRWWDEFPRKKGIDWRITAYMAFRAGMAFALGSQKIGSVSLFDLESK